MIRADMIPDEVVEAAAKALYETWCAVNEVAETSLPWDDIYDGERNACIAEARAAIAAAINAWPGAFPWTFNGPLAGTGFVLPMPQAPQ